MTDTDYTFVIAGEAFTIAAPDRSTAMQTANHTLDLGDNFYGWQGEGTTLTAMRGVWD